jgi:hypothetical protein
MDMHTQTLEKTIQASESGNDLSLSPVLMLVMPDGRVVLVSAYELDRLLPEWWVASSQSQGHSSACVYTQFRTGVLEERFRHCSDEVLTLVKLFRGYIAILGTTKRSLEQAARRVPKSHLVVKGSCSCRSSRLSFSVG